MQRTNPPIQPLHSRNFFKYRGRTSTGKPLFSNYQFGKNRSPYCWSQILALECDAAGAGPSDSATNGKPSRRAGEYFRSCWWLFECAVYFLIPFLLLLFVLKPCYSLKFFIVFQSIKNIHAYKILNFIYLYVRFLFKILSFKLFISFFFFFLLGNPIDFFTKLTKIH